MLNFKNEKEKKNVYNYVISYQVRLKCDTSNLYSVALPKKKNKKMLIKVYKVFVQTFSTIQFY